MAKGVFMMMCGLEGVSGTLTNSKGGGTHLPRGYRNILNTLVKLKMHMTELPLNYLEKGAHSEEWD